MNATLTFNIDTVPAHHRDRVAALIPDPALVGAYVNRTVAGVRDFDLFDYAANEGDNVLLVGPTGSAKTTAFRAFAAYCRAPFASIDCFGGMDPAVNIGRTVVLVIDGEQVPVFVDGDALLVIRYGGVLLIDEINMAHPRLTAGFHPLLAVARRLPVPENGETVRAGMGGTGAPQRLFIGAAMNDRYQGTVRLSEAMVNRFGIQLDWPYDRAVERKLVPSERLLDAADNLRNMADIRTPVPTNALQNYVRHARALSVDVASYLFTTRFEADEKDAVSAALAAIAVGVAADLGATYNGRNYIDPSADMDDDYNGEDD